MLRYMENTNVEIKLVVAGGRDFDDYILLCKTIYDLETDFKLTEIISGGARGADSLGEKYAIENNITLKRFAADWKTYGKVAGFIRNEEMANYGNMLLAFWDGKSKGTKNMIELAKRNNLIIKVVGYNKNSLF